MSRPTEEQMACAAEAARREAAKLPARYSPARRFAFTKGLFAPFSLRKAMRL